MTPPTLTTQTEQGPLRMAQGSTLADAVGPLLRADGRAPSTVATAVNGEFVPRHNRATHVLHDGDTVLCFSPITGG